ncbi:Similar to DOLPP1: Dolichyldiphosphatase 1 (Rhinolophus ferrumequinum) [Cotesia congregata]|uniref:Dolichyldiphosphatase 1 n=1 Tax=Cotesia congregata TaxID=51543 RepID=A0A8J2MLL4_COTCN|nr:Similar to DOLPP1: Dolichyldiphosphatase 1 (Rhinolophus ferrumequinum) [Cotesia congregata]
MAAVDDEYLHHVSSNIVNNNYQQNIKWIPLSVSLVEYPQGDSLGLGLALISLMPLALIVGFITLIAFRRDLHTICFFIGVIVTDIVGLFLKYTIKEARPMKRDVVYVEYGMPSTHSLLMWFFATYTALFVCLRWTIIGGCATVAVLVSYSRIYLQYHTISQVLCGFVVGIIMGVTWFFITHLVLAPFFPIIVSRLSEFLLIRDSTLIPNVLWFEYTNIRTEARARSRKLVSMKSQ